MENQRGKRVYDKWVIISLPYGFSILMQAIMPGVRYYAVRAARITNKLPFKEDAPIMKRSVELAVHVYRQLSFILSILLASISCIIYTVDSDHRVFIVVGIVALISIIPIWLFYWQGLPARDLEGDKGRNMAICAWSIIIIEWILTIIANI